jgi:sRNA-binding protein
MCKQLAVGDKVKFTLGDTPMLGTILFAVGTNAVAVSLTSGAEIIIDLDTINN